MARTARVVLKTAVSHSARGRTFAKGEAQVLTQEADIAYYLAQPEFTVTISEVVAPKKPATPKAVVVEEEDEGGEPGVYTEEELKSKTKLELLNVADSMGVDSVDTNSKKNEIVTSILAAQALKA